MVGTVLDIDQLFSQYFGYKPMKFDMDKKPTEGQYADLGSPFYAKDVKGREYFLPVKLGGVDLPYTTISIRNVTHIEETLMPEVDGSVIENASMGSYNITVKGLLINHDKQYPQAEITKLKELRERKEALQLRNVLTDIFLKGNQKVVITSFEIPEYGGTKHVRPFTLELLEDKELELELA